MILPTVTSFDGIFNREKRVMLEVLQKELLWVNLHSLNCVKTERAVRGSLHVHIHIGEISSIHTVLQQILMFCGKFQRLHKQIFFYNNTGKDESMLLIFRGSTKTFPL
jgi:hypothetical protein